MAADAKNDPKTPPPRAAVVVGSAPARAQLECTAGPEKGQTFRLAPATTTLGRDAAGEVVLTETAISRQHARIERRGEQWVLRNLSPNGTLVNKKPAEEVVLADGDEIRVGAKTRLRFVVEAVAAPAGGRPQFRRRSAVEEEAPPAAEAEAPEAEEAPPSLFQRRRGLFIGLGVYVLVALVVLMVGLLYSRRQPASDDGLPILSIEDMIRPAPGASALRIVRESPEGFWCEGYTGDSVLVPHEDLRSGKAIRLHGIRKALDIKFSLEPNAYQAESLKREAIELYRGWRLPGKEGHLCAAVRRFQKSLAYAGGRSYFEDGTVDKIYRDALKELIDEVYKDYNSAIFCEKAGSPKKAWEKYQRVLRLVPERDNPIVANVLRRMSALRKNVKDLK